MTSESNGLDGVRRSTELYQALFEDLAIEVVDQVSEGTESDGIELLRRLGVVRVLRSTPRLIGALR